MAFVRPNLEYGCEVWRPNKKEEQKLEPIQSQAGVTMFKLNKKTSTHAVRALMRVPSLRLRWARLKFNYFAKVKSMSRSRLVRRVLELQPDDRGHPQHWLPKTRGELRKAAKDDEKFKQEYDKLLQSLRRNSGVLPLAIDLTVLNEDR